MNIIVENIVAVVLGIPAWFIVFSILFMITGDIIDMAGFRAFFRKSKES